MRSFFALGWLCPAPAPRDKTLGGHRFARAVAALWQRSTLRRLRPQMLILVAILLACWPVWPWYAGRVGDGSDEPLGIISLLTLALILLRDRSALSKSPPNHAAVTVLLVIYAITFWWSPPLVQAVLATTALAVVASTALFRALLHPAPWLLLVLSLPVLASLQFYAGYPLREAVAGSAATLFRMAGFAVTAASASLTWGGHTVSVDAPCSGLKMLWAALYLAGSLACSSRLSAARTVVLAVAAIVFTILGNVVRVSALFLLETNAILPPSLHSRIPEWLHEGTGLASFLFVAGAMATVFVFLRKGDSTAHCTGGLLSNLRTPDTPPPLRPGHNRSRLALAAAVLVAALVPLLPLRGEPALAAPLPFPGWPQSFDGAPLRPEPLSAAENRFAANFPGKLAKFTDGQREIIIRWLYRESRQLHPAADCFKGSGYTIHPQPLVSDNQGRLWSTLEASRGHDRLRVRERIFDTAGGSWTDVSAWYWSALLGKSSRPWWTVTVVERIPR